MHLPWQQLLIPKHTIASPDFILRVPQFKEVQFKVATSAILRRPGPACSPRENKAFPRSLPGGLPT